MSRAWMPMYWGDYLADTQHLTTLQHGAYCLLIAHYWQNGSLPSDEQAIARISRLSRGEWNSNGRAIAKLFLPGWKHKRIDNELEKLRVLSEKRAMAGYIGGKANRGKNNNERVLTAAFAKHTDAQSPSKKDEERRSLEGSLATALGGALRSPSRSAPIAPSPELVRVETEKRSLG
jgi:uncharacterized protein YdaU (DUF1376 family)